MANSYYIKYMVLVGAFMINIPLCIPMIFGNLSTYMFSLFVYLTVPDAKTISPAIILGFSFVCWCFTTLAVDPLRYRLGLRWTIAIGIFFVISSFLFTYGTVQVSVWATTLTLMAMGGIGDGIVAPISMLFVAGWFESKSVGLAMSVVGAASGIGGFVFNELITSYINPNNLSPRLVIGQTTYFDQPELLERTPIAFVIVGCIAGVVQLTGFCLLRVPKTKENKEEEMIIMKEKGKEREKEKPNGGGYGKDHPKTNGVVDKTSHIPNGIHKNEDHMNENVNENKGDKEQDGTDAPTIYSSEHKLKPTSNGTSHNNKTPHEKSAILNGKNQQNKTPTNNEKTKPVESSETSDEGFTKKDRSPMQVLRLPTFYVIWFSAVAESLGLLITGTYYKLFGQLYIADDMLLAVIGGFSSILCIFTRLMCGHMIDRFGVKTVLVVHTGLSTVFLSFWYFTPAFSKWLFFVWTNVLFTLHNNLFVMYPITCLKLFGIRHYANNLFLIQTAKTIAMVASAPLLNLILDSFGWFWLFNFGACVTATSCLMLLFCAKT